MALANVTGEPSATDVHVPGIAGGNDDPAAEAKKHKSAFSKLVELVKGGGKHTPEEVTKMAAKARAHGRKAGERAFFPISLSEGEPPEWAPLLPIPGEYPHPTYGPLNMTEEKISRMVQQFNDGIYQKPIPIDGEHQTKTSGAMGWIYDVRLNEDGSADAQVKWTERGRVMLSDQRYKFISPEWYEEWEDPATGKMYTDVLIGCAITTRPFFKAGSLRPLAAHEMGPFGDEMEPEGQEDTDDLADAVADMVFDGLSIEEITDLVTKADALARAGKAAYDKAAALTPMQQYKEPIQSIQETQKMTEEAKTPTSVTLTEEQAREFAESSAKIKALTEENSRITAEAKAATEASAQMAERVATIEKNNRSQRFLSEVEGRSPASAIKWFGETAGHVEMLDKLAVAFGEDSAEVKHYIDINRAHATSLSEKISTPPQGRSAVGAGPDSALGKVNAMAEAKRTANPKLSMAESVTEVALANPELYRQYTEELSKS